MVVYEDHTYQECSLYPDTNFIPPEDERQPKWVVPDNSEVAAKIRSTGLWEPVEDSEGNLIDITAVPYIPSQEELALVRVEEIKAELAEIDSLAVRPLRAIVAGTATDEDRARLAELEARADALRAELDKPEVS